MSTLTLPDTNGFTETRSSALDRLRSRSVVAAEAEIVLDLDWRDQLDKAREKAALLTATDEDRAEHERLLAMRPDKVERWTFRRISPSTFEKLIKAHPPTEEQKARAKADGSFFAPQWNHETFIPALVAETIVEPRLTAEEVRALYEGDEALLSHGELLVIGEAALSAQRRPTPIQ